MKFDIIIIGAGASGLAAAYQAIKNNSELKILVIEKENIAGRKLNASGNGKCNLTNQIFHTDCYHSENHNFIENWVQMHSYQEVIHFFKSVGILLYEKNGYYYPVSNQAKQVSTLLYEKSRKCGVTFAFQTEVTDIRPVTDKKQSYFEITALQETTKKIHYNAKHIILATGGFASSKLGGCKSGYKLAKNLNLDCNSIYPVLSPVYIKDSNLKYAKGVRLDGNVTLEFPDGTTIKESGQIQFNDNNLSGIVMMNLSCYLNQKKEMVDSALLHIDTMPQYSWDDLKRFFDNQATVFPEESIETLLIGILPSAFANYLLRRLNLNKDQLLRDLTVKQINRLTSSIKKLKFNPVYVEDFEKAQVTGGGICVEQIHTDTFESCKYKNLYITGEVLDVNGKCGGYNLTFAILSGIQAADSIVEKYKH